MAATLYPQTQGLNLHWQADFFTTEPPGKMFSMPNKDKSVAVRFFLAKKLFQYKNTFYVICLFFLKNDIDSK